MKAAAPVVPPGCRSSGPGGIGGQHDHGLRRLLPGGGGCVGIAPVLGHQGQALPGTGAQCAFLQMGRSAQQQLLGLAPELALHAGHADRKSTRLNSSHTVISYAVFCLKKKNTSEVVSDVMDS